MSASSSILTIYSFIPTSPLQVLNLVPIPIPIISTSPENPPPRTPPFPTSLLIPTSHFPKLRVVLPRLRKRRFQLLQKKIKQPPELRKLRNAFFLLVKYCHLNASTLSNPNSLHIPLTSPLISDSETPTPTLIDSGSSHCLWILYSLCNTIFQFPLFRLYPPPSSPAHFDYPSSSLPMNLRLWTFLSFRLTPLASWFLD